MTERPMLFSGPMVRALLAGRKTQTRRQIKLPHENPLGVWEPSTVGGPGVHNADGGPVPEGACLWHTRTGDVLGCRYGQPGDCLWVKETHAIVPRSAYAMSDGVQQTLRPDDAHDAAVYAAGWERSKPGRWRPSIHMPRWASRLTLKITDVRAERLLDCSDTDAKAEGLEWVTPGMWAVDRTLPIISHEPRAAYFELWDHINGTGAAAANPWVWAITFDVQARP